MAEYQSAVGTGLLEPEVEGWRQVLFDLFTDLSPGAALDAGQLIDDSRIDVEACDAERLMERNPHTLTSLALRRPEPDMLDILLSRSALFKSIDPAAAGAALLAEAARQGASHRVMLKVWRLCQSCDFQDIHGFSPLGRALERGALVGDCAPAIFLLERGADLCAPAFQDESAAEMALRLQGPGAAQVRSLVSSPLAPLVEACLQRCSDFDRELAEALSSGDVAGAQLAAHKGGVVRWGPFGSAEEPAAFEAGDAACEARELLRPLLHQGRVDAARFFLLETPISRVELFMEALLATCPSEEVFALAIGGFRETTFAGPGKSTLLHEAVLRGNAAAARALLRRGADPSIANLYGQTPARLASESADRELAAVFGFYGPGKPLTAPDSGRTTEPELPPGAPIVVFTEEAVALAEARFAGADTERKRASDRAISRMRKGSGVRIGVQAPAACLIRELEHDYPTFAEVIDVVAERAAVNALVAQKSGKPCSFKLPNILLVGKPGMGKTHFLKKLALALGSSYQMIQMGATSAGFVLAGMDSGWSGAKPGKIFDALAEGNCANPVLALDEIDKISRDDRYPVNGPLFALLERGTAKDWRDEFVDAPMDASHINYFATANDSSMIDEAILSRFNLFEIPDPGPEEAERIARSVYREVLKSEGWGQIFEPEISGDVLDRLAEATPRESHALLGQALPKACAKGRDHLLLEDFKAPKAAKTSMGFVW